MNDRNLFTSAGNISFSRRILHRGLGKVILVIVCGTNNVLSTLSGKGHCTRRPARVSVDPERMS